MFAYLTKVKVCLRSKKVEQELLELEIGDGIILKNKEEKESTYILTEIKCIAAERKFSFIGVELKGNSDKPTIEEENVSFATRDIKKKRDVHQWHAMQ